MDGISYSVLSQAAKGLDTVQVAAAMVEMIMDLATRPDYDARLMKNILLAMPREKLVELSSLLTTETGGVNSVATPAGGVTFTHRKGGKPRHWVRWVDEIDSSKSGGYAIEGAWFNKGTRTTRPEGGVVVVGYKETGEYQLGVHDEGQSLTYTTDTGDLVRISGVAAKTARLSWPELVEAAKKEGVRIK